MIMGYTVPQIWCAMDVIAISHFGQVFALLQKIPFQKISEKKIPGDIIIEHKCTQNHDHMLYCF